MSSCAKRQQEKLQGKLIQQHLRQLRACQTGRICASLPSEFSVLYIPVKRKYSDWTVCGKLYAAHSLPYAQRHLPGAYVQHFFVLVFCVHRFYALHFCAHRFCAPVFYAHLLYVLCFCVPHFYARCFCVLQPGVRDSCVLYEGFQHLHHDRISHQALPPLCRLGKYLPEESRAQTGPGNQTKDHNPKVPARRVPACQIPPHQVPLPQA